MRRNLTIIALALLGACGKGKHDDKAKDTPTSAAPAIPATAAEGSGAILDAWKQAGLAPASFSATDGKALGGGKCQAGTIDTLKTTLCEYPDESTASAAEEAGRKVVGDTTGYALARGKFLLVVTDAAKADPQGKKLNLIAKVYEAQADPARAAREAAARTPPPAASASTTKKPKKR